MPNPHTLNLLGFFTIYYYKKHRGNLRLLHEFYNNSFFFNFLFFIFLLYYFNILYKKLKTKLMIKNQKIYKILFEQQFHYETVTIFLFGIFFSGNITLIFFCNILIKAKTLNFTIYY